MSKRDLPEVRQLRGSPMPIDGKCGAKLVLTDPPRYCTEWPKRGRTRCKFHGGNQPRGIAANNWQTGQHSTVMPSLRLAQDYERLLKDEDLTSLRKEIAWQRAYYRDVQARTADGTLVAKALFGALDRLATAWRAFQAARKGQKEERIRETLAGVEQALGDVQAARDPAHAEASARAELRACWRDLANLTDKENRQIERLYNYITAERAFALSAAETACFIDALEKYVTDVELKTAIRGYVAARLDGLNRPAEALDVGASPGAPDDGAPGDAATAAD